MKTLLKNPDSIGDFKAWTDALDEAAETFLTEWMISRNEMDAMMEYNERIALLNTGIGADSAEDTEAGDR